MQCNKCSCTIDRNNERYTICEGACAKRYHATCVGLSEATVSAFFSKNVLWMCDQCLLDFCTVRDANSSNEIIREEDIETCCKHQTTCETEIEELKEKVDNIIYTLAAMATQNTQLQPTPDNGHHSTPVSTSVHFSNLLNGTKNGNESMSDNSDLAQSDFDDTFSLFVTNIDRAAKETDVERLVCSCLNIVDSSNIRVRRLVSKQRLHEQDYISFKIVLDKKLKPLAMNPSTWPRNVKFREFENRRTFWKPKHT